MVGPLEAEVTESLRGESVDVGDKTRVGIVLDVAAVNKMFHPIQRTPFATFELDDVRLAEINLEGKERERERGKR